MANNNRGEKLMSKSGAAVEVPNGRFQINGRDNKAYFKCIFTDSTNRKLYCVKVYADSRYSPSSDQSRHVGRDCCPFTVQEFEFSPTRRFGSRSGGKRSRSNGMNWESGW